MVKAGQLQQEQVAALLPTLTPRNQYALEIWQQLGKFDWQGIAMLVDLHDVDDPADLIERLILIRDGIIAAQESPQ